MKKTDEYRIGYEFAELAEDIQKLRKAKLMLQHNISQEKVCKYTTLEITELQVLNDLLNQREEILNQIPDIIKRYLNYGYNYVNKIIVKKMIEDNCTNQEIQEFVNLTEDSFPTPQNINTEAVSKALIIRINDIYEQTHKWKPSAPDKPEARQEILDLCKAYNEINKNKASELDKILEIQKTVELW